MKRLDYGTIYEIIEELTGVMDTEGDDVVYDLLNEAIAHMPQPEASEFIEYFLRVNDYMELWTFYFGDSEDKKYWERANHE